MLKPSSFYRVVASFQTSPLVPLSSSPTLPFFHSPLSESPPLPLSSSPPLPSPLSHSFVHRLLVWFFDTGRSHIEGLLIMLTSVPSI